MPMVCDFGTNLCESPTTDVDAASRAIDDAAPADAAPKPIVWGLIAGNAAQMGSPPVPTEPVRLYMPMKSSSSVWNSEELDWTRGIDYGDVDHDGDVDLFVGNGFLSTRADRVYVNNGDGTFSVAFTTAERLNTRKVGAGDFDGDTDLDFLALDTNLDGQVQLYRGNGDGSFGVPSAVTDISGYNLDAGLAVGDVDNDGDLDFVVCAGGGEVHLFRNDRGTFTGSLAGGDVGSGYATAALGDMDRDGDLDLATNVVFGSGGGVTRVYRNQGSSFALLWDSFDLVPEISDHVSDIAWADVDGDGDGDVVSVSDEGVNRVYLNKGGTFGLGWSTPESDASTGVAVADYDNDGDIDLAFANRNEPNRIYSNNGDGTFTLAWSSADFDNTAAIRWVPMN